MTATLDRTGTRDDGVEPASRQGGPGPIQLVALLVAVAFLAGVIGWRVAQPSHPGRDSVDVGFLNDMAAHHEQAIGLSFAYLQNGQDPLLIHMARETITYQASEIGWFNLLLSQWNENQTRPETMAWMGMSHGAAMPGMATNAEIAQLEIARELEADDQFTRLMIRHHRGGVHMADYAATHAQGTDLRERAAAMAKGQRSEIAEMNTQRIKLGLEPV